MPFTPPRNPEVFLAWKEGRAAANKRLSTDGNTLWSYDLPIGITQEGRKLVYDARPAAGHVFSQTTHKHVNQATKFGDDVVPLPMQVKLDWSAGLTGRLAGY